MPVTPLAGNTYGSRFNLNLGDIYSTQFEYENMIYHGFYGGTSLQSQELNELQENIQNQISQLNSLIGNWVEYKDGENKYSQIGLPDFPNVLIPVHPNGITLNLNGETINKGWFLYTIPDLGQKIFISLPKREDQLIPMYTTLSRRVARKPLVAWVDLLSDIHEDISLNKDGAHRIQLFSTDTIPIPGVVDPEFDPTDATTYLAAFDNIVPDSKEIVSRLSDLVKGIIDVDYNEVGLTYVSYDYNEAIESNDTYTITGVQQSTNTFTLNYSSASPPTITNALNHTIFDRARYVRPFNVNGMSSLIAERDPVFMNSTYNGAAPGYYIPWEEAWALSRADAVIGSWIRQYGLILALSYGTIKNKLGSSESVVINGRTFTTADRDILLLKCKDAISEITKYKWGLQRANHTLEVDNDHFISGDPITDNHPWCNGLSRRPGGAGGYLGSTWCISGITDMLSILGDDVPASDRALLELILKREIILIVKNWKQCISWYVSGNQSNTNQWQDPAMAMINACLFIGNPAFLPAYNLGVALVAESLIVTLGDKGEYPEGYAYANQSAYNIVHTLRSMRKIDDTRLDTMTTNWLKNHWRWLLDHMMPGNRIANYADNRAPFLKPWQITEPPLAVSIAAFAAFSQNPSALNSDPIKTINYLYPNSAGADPLQLEIIPHLHNSAYGPPELKMPNFEIYPDGAYLTWRSARDIPQSMVSSGPQSNHALWIKGASPKDGHTHRDAGHLNVYCGGRMVLMDSGANYGNTIISNITTPQLSVPTTYSAYSRSAAGHSIMQIDEVLNDAPFYSGWTGCPISVVNMTNTGGNVNLNLIGAYKTPSAVAAPNAYSWVVAAIDAITSTGKVRTITRNISWNYESTTTKDLKITITDKVKFKDNIPMDTLMYKWHTGVSDNNPADIPDIAGSGTNWSVSWDSGFSSMSIGTNYPIKVSTAVNADFSQNDSANREDHYALYITPASLVGLTAENELIMTTNITVKKYTQ